MYGHRESLPCEISSSHNDACSYSKLGHNWALDDGSHSFGGFMLALFLVWNPARCCNRGLFRESCSQERG